MHNSQALPTPDKAAAVHENYPLSTTWIPRAVRCPRCLALAREAVRERHSEEEVAVRYHCGVCQWQRTHHYHESELVR